MTLIDLSHPAPRRPPDSPGPSRSHIPPFRTREDHRTASGTDFQVDHVTMVGNTGTYLDSPFHRFAEGGDLASVPLSSVADLPIFSSWTCAATGR